MLVNRSGLNGAWTIVPTLAENQEIELSIFSVIVDGFGEGQCSMVAFVFTDNYGWIRQSKWAVQLLASSCSPGVRAANVNL
jgi:hypothetical protein